MATIVDSLVVTLGLDASHFKREAGTINVFLKDTREQAINTGRELEARGKQGAEFFGQIKREALSLMAVLLGGRGIEAFTANAVQSMAALGKEAANVGMTVPALDAFRKVIERSGGSADEASAAVRGLVDAMERYKLLGQGSPEFIGSLRTIGAGPNDSAMEVIKKFYAFAQAHQGDHPLVNLLGRAIGLPQSVIDNSYKGLDVLQKELALSSDLGLTTENMSKQAQQLQHDWIGLRQAAENLGNTVQTNLSPALDKILLWATKYLEKSPDVVTAVTGVTAALIALSAIRFSANLMGLGGLYTALSGMAAMAAAIALSIANVADMVQRGPFGNIPANEGIPADLNDFRQNKFYGYSARLHFSGVDPRSGVLEPPGAGSSAASVMEKARAFFSAKGLSDDQVAGILANIGAESGFDPSLNITDSNGLRSYGLFQHNGERYKAMQDYFHTATPSADQQLEFAWMELSTTYAPVLQKLKQQRSAAGSAGVFTDGFEKPKNTAGEIARRGFAAPSFLSTPPSVPSLPPDILNNPLGPQSNAAGPTTITIGSIAVHTQATDARGISRDFASSLNDALIAQANRGLT